MDPHGLNNTINQLQMSNLINAGSVEDIRCTLQHAYSKLSIRDLLGDIYVEKHGSNRSTVIKLLEAAVHKKQKEKKGKAGTCKVCGCREMSACYDHETGTCFWIYEDLCSACATPFQRNHAIQQLMKKSSGQTGLGACLNK
jgi:hypothetical protein